MAHLTDDRRRKDQQDPQAAARDTMNRCEACGKLTGMNAEVDTMQGVSQLSAFGVLWNGSIWLKLLRYSCIGIQGRCSDMPDSMRALAFATEQTARRGEGDEGGSAQDYFRRAGPADADKLLALAPMPNLC